jgi:hypothetical protein
MNSLIAKEEHRETVEDYSPLNCIRQNLATVSDKAFWERFGLGERRSEQNFGAANRRLSFENWRIHKELRDFRIYFADSGMHLDVHVACEPADVADFFETASNQEFQEFCVLLEPKRGAQTVYERVQLLTACLTSDVSLLRGRTGLQCLAAGVPLQLPAPREPKEGKDIAEKIREIEDLIVSQRVDDGLDKLYSYIDFLMRGSHFSTVNRLFNVVNVHEASVDLLLGLLIATLPVKRRARLRPAFFQTVKEELEKREEDTSELLAGLD